MGKELSKAFYHFGCWLLVISMASCLSNIKLMSVLLNGRVVSLAFHWKVRMLCLRWSDGRSVISNEVIDKRR